MTRTLAVVPIRGGQGGKTRLATSFSGQERTHLVRHMLEHVLETIEESRAVDHTLIVTCQPHGVPGGNEHRTVLLQPEDRLGLNVAVGMAREWAERHDYDAMLIVLPDLPLLEAPDVRRMVSSTTPIAIAPDRHERGTNALWIHLGALPPGQRFAFAFGDQSLERHRDEAARTGLEVSTLVSRGLQVDLDTPDDWLLLPIAVRDQFLVQACRTVSTPFRMVL